METELKIMKVFDPGRRVRVKFGCQVTRDLPHAAVEGFLYVDPSQFNLEGILGFQLVPIRATEAKVAIAATIPPK